MKAVATDGRSGLEVVDIPRPHLPEDGGLVRVLACGLCGSDLEKLSGVPAGRVLGHEVVGLLERPGQPPRRVALAHHVPCGRCARCRAGHSSLCEQFLDTDLEPGGFAETLAVSSLHLADAVFALPAEVDDLAGTLLEPLSCVLRALDTGASLLRAYPLPEVQGSAVRQGASETPAPAQDPESVLVAGCGAVGLLFLSILQAGAWSPPHIGGSVSPGPDRQGWRPEKLFFLEPREERAALAESLQATALPEIGSGGPPVHLAILTAPAALPQVVEAMAPGGVIVVFAAGAESPKVDFDLLYRRELTLAGVRSGSPAHLRAALRILAAGLLDLSWLQPLVVGLPELPSAVERYGRGDVLKVVVRP